jgi:hypothetical protein
MPITKYKTFEEAEKALYCFNPDNNYYDRLEKFFQIATDLYPPKAKRGIIKFRTFEEFCIATSQIDTDH